MTKASFLHLMDQGGIHSAKDPMEWGFLVEKAEGEKNHQDYAGNLSWVSEAEFLYQHQSTGAETDEPAFLQRLRLEQLQLDQKLKELLAFTKHDAFFNLVQLQRDLLLEQARHMLRYSTTLHERINAHLSQIAHKKSAVAANAARQ